MALSSSSSRHFLLLLLLLYSSSSPSRAAPKKEEKEETRDFYSDREAMIEAEDQSFLGADIVLSSLESDVNDHLMSLKEEELDTAFQESHYPPSTNFFQARSDIEASDVFEFIRGMPKGGALHIHDFSIASNDWIVSDVTYREGLYMCQPDDPDGYPRFTWLNSPDETSQVPVTCEGSSSSDWMSMSDLRLESGADAVDKYIKSKLVLTVDDPADAYPDVNTVWAAFENRLLVLNSIIYYEPVVRDFVQQALGEFRQDKVQFMEIRSTLPSEICTNKGPDCAPLTQMELAALFQEESDAFLSAHSDMCAVRFIYAPIRSVEEEVVEEYLSLAGQLVESFPDFFVGFDLVGQEDLGRPLVDFADQLVEAKEGNPNLTYFFHAGETDWQGQTTDLNVMDALLLGTKRIGHGYAITKHPESKQLAIDSGVPIEVCPLSNQVLGLVKDLRNHPAAALIQEGFPLVISSDNPASWEASGLSYDFYQAFMGLASRTMDLRLLKQLVFSSVEYSSLRGDAKESCQGLVETEWDIYMQSVATRRRRQEQQLAAGREQDRVVTEEEVLPQIGIL